MDSRSRNSIWRKDRSGYPVQTVLVVEPTCSMRSLLMSICAFSAPLPVTPSLSQSDRYARTPLYCCTAHLQFTVTTDTLLMSFCSIGHSSPWFKKYSVSDHFPLCFCQLVYAQALWTQHCFHRDSPTPKPTPHDSSAPTCPATSSRTDSSISCLLSPHGCACSQSEEWRGLTTSMPAASMDTGSCPCQTVTKTWRSMFALILKV